MTAYYIRWKVEMKFLKPHMWKCIFQFLQFIRDKQDVKNKASKLPKVFWQTRWARYCPVCPLLWVPSRRTLICSTLLSIQRARSGRPGRQLGCHLRSLFFQFFKCNCRVWTLHHIKSTLFLPWKWMIETLVRNIGISPKL